MQRSESPMPRRSNQVTRAKDVKPSRASARRGSVSMQSAGRVPGFTITRSSPSPMLHQAMWTSSTGTYRTTGPATTFADRLDNG